MALKNFKPVTPSQRGLVLVDRSGLWKGKPVKSLTVGLHSNGGRNNGGRFTTRHKGGGHKQRYRIIDFKRGGHKRRYRVVDFRRRKTDMPATVQRLEYDPNRSAFIALIKYEDGELNYILAPQRLGPGDVVVSSQRADIKPGNCMPMENIPTGTIIHNIEMKPGRGGQIARAAGTYAQLVGKDAGYAQLRLSSGELRMVPARCIATIGSVANQDNNQTWLYWLEEATELAAGDIVELRAMGAAGKHGISNILFFSLFQDEGNLLLKFPDLI